MMSKLGGEKCGFTILAAALMVPGKVRFENLPHLNDVTTMLQLLGRMGLKSCSMTPAL